MTTKQTYTVTAGEATTHVQASCPDEAKEIARPRLEEILAANTSEIPAEIIVTDPAGRQSGFSF